LRFSKLAQRLDRAALTVIEEHTPGDRAAFLDPGQQLRLICMRRVALNPANLCPDGYVTPGNFHALGAFQNDSAKRAFCLEPDEKDCRIPARQVVKQVMPYSPGLAHTRCRQDDRP